MTDASETIKETQIVPADMGHTRFDQIAAKLFPDYSRSRIQSWIKNGQLTVNGKTLKPKEKLVGGETLTIDAVLEANEHWQAEDVPLDVVFEDEQIIVINKPAGLVVHPGAGTPSGTVLNGLLYRYPELAAIPRAGIVHRLDKDTWIDGRRAHPASANVIGRAAPGPLDGERVLGHVYGSDDRWRYR